MQLLTADQIAKKLQVPKTRVYEMARLGLVPCVHMGRQIRFDLRTIEQWVSQGGTIGPSERSFGNRSVS
jgi:excisionase family DNA binding protein